MMVQHKSAEPNGARYLLRALKDEGITHAFLVPGFMFEPFLSEYAEAGVIPIVACQEGGAAYMADGYSRASRNFGVAMGIGGPGVSNMVTAVAAAYSDRSPILVVAGNVPFTWEGLGTFQDSSPTGVEDRDIFLPMTVFTEVIPDESLIGPFLRKSIRSMKGFVNRPAFLSMPLDIQKKPMAYDYQPVNSVESPKVLDVQAAQKVPALLADATRITILAGNGAVWSNAADAIKSFANKYSIPVVSTMRAKGVIPEDDEMSMGVFGVGGSLWANQVVMGDPDTNVPGAEVLIILGATLNENNTHGWFADFIPSKAIVRVDINPNNVLGKEYKQCFVTGDAQTFIEWLQGYNDTHKDKLAETTAARKSWLKTIQATPFYDSDAERTSESIPMSPPRVITELRKVAPRDTVMIVDSGAHSFFTSHYWTSYNPNEFLLLSTTGPMGYGVAMTIGAKLARPDRPHCVVVGDGSLLMHGMEIHTAVRYKLPMVITVINNSALANVYLRAINESEEAMQLSTIPTQDWAAFAKSLGADGVTITDPTELSAAFEQGFSTTDRPFLIDARCVATMPTPNTKESS